MTGEDDPSTEAVLETLRGGFSQPRTVEVLETWRVTTEVATDQENGDLTPFFDVVEGIIDAAYTEAHQEYARVEQTTGKENLSHKIQNNLSELILSIGVENPEVLIDHQHRLVETSLAAEGREQTWNYQQTLTTLADHDDRFCTEVVETFRSIFVDETAGQRRSTAGYYIRCFASDHSETVEQALSEVREVLQESPPPVRAEAAKIVRNLANTGFMSDEDPPSAVLDMTKDLEPLLQVDEDSVQEAAIEALSELSEHVPERMTDMAPELVTFIGQDEVSFSATQTLTNIIEAEPTVVENFPRKTSYTISDESPKTQEHHLRVFKASVEADHNGGNIPPLVSESLSAVIDALQSDERDVRSEASELLDAIADRNPALLVDKADQIITGLTANGSRLHTRWTLEKLLKYDTAVYDDILPACRDLIESRSTGRKTRDAIMEVFHDAAEQNPQRALDVVDLLGNALENSDDDVVYHACLALSDIAKEEPSAVVEYTPELLEIVADENARGRSTAASTLDEIAEVDPDAVAEGLDALVEMYLSISSGRSAKMARIAMRTTIGERPSRAGELISDLRNAIQSDNNDRRVRALILISSLIYYNPDPFYELRPLIEDSFESDHERTREMAIDCIEEFADQEPARVTEAVPMLGTALQDEVSDIRQNAANALRNIASDDPEAVVEVIDDITAAFYDSEDYTKDTVCKVIKEIAAELDTVPANLFEALVAFGLEYSSSTDTSNAVDAVGALAASLDHLPQSVESSIHNALCAESTNRRTNAAAVAMVLAGETTGGPILSFDEGHNSIPEGTTRLLPSLQDCLTDSNEDVREYAMRAICGLAADDPAAVVPAIPDINALLSRESEARGQAMFPAAEAVYHLAGHDPDALLLEDGEVVENLFWMSVVLGDKSFDESPAGQALGSSLYTTYGAKALGRIAQSNPKPIDRYFRDENEEEGGGDGEETLADIYIEELGEDTQENFIGVLKELTPGVPDIFGENNEELTELFERAPEVRDDIAEMFCIMASSDPERAMENVPELMSALDHNPSEQTARNIIHSVALIAEKESIALVDYRGSIRQLFIDETLDTRGEVMAVDLLVRMPSLAQLALPDLTE